MKKSNYQMNDIAKRGIEACIEAIGESIYEQYADNSVYAYEEADDGKIYCFVGLSTFSEDKGKVSLTEGKNWEYYASCYASDSGIEMSDCRLPLENWVK